MIDLVRHVVRVLQSRRRESAKRSERSSQWPAVEHVHLARHPTCAACGGCRELQVHHVAPFHLYPALELTPSNLLTLCMAHLECHLRIGHGGDFHRYNQRARTDAAEALAHPDRRSIIELRAREDRKPL